MSEWAPPDHPARGASARQDASSPQVPASGSPASEGGKRPEPDTEPTKPEKGWVIELRCTHGNPKDRDPRVRYICPADALWFIAGAIGIITYIALAVFGR